MRIRPVEIGDAARTAELLNAIIATGAETSMSEPLSLDEQKAYIEGFPPRGVFLVAEDAVADRIIGMQSIEPCGDVDGENAHVAEISTFIDAKCRGAGVGTALMRALVEKAAVHGIHKLLAYIRADNAPAIGFYERSGFRRVGVLERQLRYRGRWLDQVVYERWLGHGEGEGGGNERSTR